MGYTLIISSRDGSDQEIVTYPSWEALLNRLTSLVDLLLKSAQLVNKITFRDLVFNYLNLDRDSTQIQLGNWMLILLNSRLIEPASDYILEISFNRWKKWNFNFRMA